MVNKSSIRIKNTEKYQQCVNLRKKGFSYSEIQREVSVAKSTLQNWLTLAGLTFTKEHLEIQLNKRLSNKAVAVEASRITRIKKAEKEIEIFVQQYKKYLEDPMFVAGIMIYEAEGAKKGNSRFSNSDYRLVQLFVNFTEKYFLVNKAKNMNFRLYIHEARKNNLIEIKQFWSDKLQISKEDIKVSWKKNIIKHRRFNFDYKGQLSLTIIGIPLLTRKLLALSSIILSNNAGSSNGRTTAFGAVNSRFDS